MEPGPWNLTGRNQSPVLDSDSDSDQDQRLRKSLDKEKRCGPNDVDLSTCLLDVVVVDVVGRCWPIPFLGGSFSTLKWIHATHGLVDSWMDGWIKTTTKTRQLRHLYPHSFFPVQSFFIKSKQKKTEEEEGKRRRKMKMKKN